MESKMIISASQLRWQTTCERRIWLDEYGDPSKRTFPEQNMQHMALQGEVHEQEIHEATTSKIIPVRVDSWEEWVAYTRQAMQRGVPGIIGAGFEEVLDLDLHFEVRLRGRVDRIERQPDGSYRIVEIKRRKKLLPADEVQLDAYLWLMSQVQINNPTGVFWLGQDENSLPLNIIEHRYDEARLFHAIDRITTIRQNSMADPGLFLAPHCRMCHWSDHCASTAEKHHELSVLNNIRRDTIADMKEKGVSSLAGLVQMEPEDLTQFHGIKTTALRMHAQARAWMINQPVWMAEPPEICSHDPWFFDIETVPNGEHEGEVWSIGWSKASGQTKALVVWPEMDRDIESLPHGHQIYYVTRYQAAWKRFETIVSVDDAPLFHWSQFDASNMRRFAPSAYDSLKHRLFDLSRLFTNTVQIPVRGISLKRVAPYVGFEWDDYNDWFHAWMDYNDWLVNQDREKLAQFSHYQTDDVLAMIVIRAWMLNR